MRFEAFLDPMNNWVVWDTKEQYFAEVGTHYLLSLPADRAKAFCVMLNILFSKKGAHEPADDLPTAMDGGDTAELQGRDQWAAGTKQKKDRLSFRDGKDE